MENINMTLNEKIGNILKTHKEGEKFFDALDYMIRGDKDILEDFYRFMKYDIINIVKNKYNPKDINIVLTGKFGLAILNNYGVYLYQSFNDVIIVDGNLRNGNIPELYKNYTEDKYWILLDDSYYSGKTKETIEKTLNIDFSKVIVIYDGSKEKQSNVFSMYRYHE